LSAPLATS